MYVCMFFQIMLFTCYYVLSPLSCLLQAVHAGEAFWWGSGRRVLLTPQSFGEEEDPEGF